MTALQSSFSLCGIAASSVLVLRAMVRQSLRIAARARNSAPTAATASSGNGNGFITPQGVSLVSNAMLKKFKALRVEGDRLHLQSQAQQRQQPQQIQDDPPIPMPGTLEYHTDRRQRRQSARLEVVRRRLEFEQQKGQQQLQLQFPSFPPASGQRALSSTITGAFRARKPTRGMMKANSRASNAAAVAAVGGEENSPSGKGRKVARGGGRRKNKKQEEEASGEGALVRITKAKMRDSRSEGSPAHQRGKEGHVMMKIDKSGRQREEVEPREKKLQVLDGNVKQDPSEDFKKAPNPKHLGSSGELFQVAKVIVETKAPKTRRASLSSAELKEAAKEEEGEEAAHASDSRGQSGRNKRKSRSQFKDPMISETSGERKVDEEGHTEIGDVVKPEPEDVEGCNGEAGQKNRKLRRPIFPRFPKVKAEVVLDHEEVASMGKRQQILDRVKPEDRGKAADQAQSPVLVAGAANTHESPMSDVQGSGLQLVVRTDDPAGNSLEAVVSLLPGPYPQYARPFPQECQEAKDLLSELHGVLPEYERHKISCPTIDHVQPLQNLRPLNPGAAMSSDIHIGVGGKPGAEGRGDNGDSGQDLKILSFPLERHSETKDMVPSGHPSERRTILDSLVGTLLSQNTTDKNSRKAFASLKAAFPTWEEVWQAGVEEVEKAIKWGGLAETKARRINSILDTLMKERGELSLEYVQSMSTEDIKKELSRFDGVGPKTVACVLMFHLQREEFPVDTHVSSQFQVFYLPRVNATNFMLGLTCPEKVFRIAKKLGWVPESAGREKAYLHLNQRIPDLLKFDLHCLLVTHGKKCPECAKRFNQQPADGPCPLLNWTSKWSRKGDVSKKALLKSE